MAIWERTGWELGSVCSCKKTVKININGEVSAAITKTAKIWVVFIGGTLIRESPHCPQIINPPELRLCISYCSEQYGE